MKLKYPGCGDIYRDQYGGTVMIKGVEERRVTYRQGYAI